MNCKLEQCQIRQLTNDQATKIDQFGSITLPCKVHMRSHNMAHVSLFYLRNISIIKK